MNLKTIDSLCAQIAGAVPALAGGGAGLAPVEEALPLLPGRLCVMRACTTQRRYNLRQSLTVWREDVRGLAFGTDEQGSILPDDIPT